jgi:predicted anti-sigma-YlaC factor YlaD
MLCIPAQDYDTFKDCLEKALAIDPDADPSTRLVTVINQRKARWLLDNAYNYFSFLPFPSD